MRLTFESQIAQIGVHLQQLEHTLAATVAGVVALAAAAALVGVDSVSWLQEALTQLGYYEGAVTGLFDRATREGLQAFQRGRALEADGRAGSLTRMALYGSLEQYAVPHLSDAGEDEG